MVSKIKITMENLMKYIYRSAAKDFTHFTMMTGQKFVP